jgi:hypothetical protein
VELFREYDDLFPQIFTEMKGIKWELGKMRIDMKLDANPINRRPYRFNPQIKEKVKEEIEKMLATILIFLVEEFEYGWYQSMFRIQRVE